jgi:hypothetical protein
VSKNKQLYELIGLLYYIVIFYLYLIVSMSINVKIELMKIKTFNLIIGQIKSTII